PSLHLRPPIERGLHAVRSITSPPGTRHRTLPSGQQQATATTASGPCWPEWLKPRRLALWSRNAPPGLATDPTVAFRPATPGLAGTLSRSIPPGPSSTPGTRPADPRTPGHPPHSLTEPAGPAPDQPGASTLR